jgi:hypothetical protein
LSPKLVVEKLPSSEPFDLAVRDGKTGFIFFNIEGDQYDYDVGAQLPSITDGRLLISPDLLMRLDALGKWFRGWKNFYSSEHATGRHSDTRQRRSPLRSNVASARCGCSALCRNGPRPEITVGHLPSVEQGGSNGTFVGLGVGTNSCNNALNPPLHWFALPNNDHPAIPQNLYRMSEDRGGYSADSEAATPLKSTKPRRLHPAP